MSLKLSLKNLLNKWHASLQSPFMLLLSIDRASGYLQGTKRVLSLHYTALIKSFLALCFFSYTTASLAADVTEDFSTSTLKDAVKTSANWSTSSENVTFPWLTQQAGVTASFATGSDISAATNTTRSLVTADINGDGYLDVITGDFGQTNKLYLNDGTGNFATGVDITNDINSTESLVVADIDGDGDLDVLTGNFNQATRLYKNDGTGNFAAGVNMSSDSKLTKSLTLADIDNDGDLDVLEGNQGQTNRLYLNDGTGNFAAGVDITADTHDTYSLTTADVDGDGDLDVLSGNISGVNRLYLNDGTGNFAAGVDITSDSAATYSLIAADIDGDGDIDILTGHFNNANRLYRNDGSGNFTTGENISSDERRTASLTLVDIDGDGDLDVLEGNAFDTSNRLYLNDGSGNFTAGVDITTDANDTRSLIAADIDGDGDLDVIAGNHDQINRVYLNNSSDLFAPGANISADTNNTTRLTTADIDGDGDIDVLAGNRGGKNLVHLNNGDGTFAAGTEISTDTHATISLTTADMDGDGDLDILEGNFGQTSWIYLNNGDGTFASGTEISADVKSSFGLTTIDIDSDGDLDVITGNWNSPNLVYLNNGDGTFASGTEISAGVFNTYNTYSLATADIDGDGDLDLLAGNWNQVNRVYLNNGDGTFATGTNISADIHYTLSLTTADIDGDGDIDVLAGNNDNQSNRVYLNNGDGTFAAGTNISADTNNTSSITTADIDGDGDIDVLAGNIDNQTNRVYLNNGDGTFAAGQNISEDTHVTSSITTADIDGDGDLDVLTGNENQTNRVYINHSASLFAVGMNISTDSNYTHSIITADIDGDGDLDVLTAEDSSPNRLYLNDGDGNLSAGINITADADGTTGITTADIDGDGDLDVLVGNHDGANRLYLSNGDGSFAAGTDISADAQSTRSITTADIDGDGDLDVIAGNSFTTANRLYRNDGNGNFNAGENITADAHSTLDLSAADIDGDGDLDVLVGNNNGANRLYRNNGNGTFAAGEDITADEHSTYSLITADIDGDGDLDVLAGNYNAANRLYRNDGAGNFVAGEDITSDSQATFDLITADIDGDGDLDVLVGNHNQTNRLYLNDGAGNFAAGLDISTDAYYSGSINVADMDGDGDLDLLVGNFGELNQIYLMGRYALNKSVASSTNVNSSGLDIAGLTLSATQTANTASTRNTDIDYYVTNNGGSRWHKVTTGQVLNFPDRGNSDVRWKATLSSASTKISPVLSEVALTFVTATNTTPVISGTPATTIAEDSAYSFTPSVTDPDSGDSKTFSITNKPSWATFNTSTGALTGTPSQAHIGTTTGIVISVKDTALATDSLASFNITVYTTNTTPVISGIPATSVAEDSVYSFTPTVTDPDSGDSKTFSISNKPSWATFSTTTGTLAGVPLQAHIGTTSGIVISVKDAENATDSLASFNITVVNTNDAPVISGTPATGVAEDSAYSFTPTVTDPDSGDSKTFSITNKPTWATFNTITGTLSGTPSRTDAANYVGIIISVKDRENASASLPAFTITVTNKNEPPIADDQTHTLDEDNQLTIMLSATDADNDELTYTIVTEASHGTLVQSTENKWTYTPEENYNGTDSFTYKATDNDADSLPATVELSINPINDAPNAQDDVIALTYNKDGHYILDVLSNDSDVDDDLLTIINASSTIGTASIEEGKLIYQLQGVIEDKIELRYIINDGHSSQEKGNSEAKITLSFDDSDNTLLPVINLPNNINIKATDLFTKVNLGVATAINSKNEPIPASLVGSMTWFAPGNNVVYWQAQDSDGFKRIATQRVTVHPLISLAKDQVGSEGEHYRVAVYLNGESPSYPVSVYYNVTGNADSDDHNLVSGELVIDSGLIGYIEFETFEDGVTELDETLIITLDSSLNQSMNVGANSQFTLTITEDNIAPQASVSVAQNNQQRTLIDKTLGEVVIRSKVFDSNSEDSHSYTWKSVSGELIDTDNDDASFTFDPASLAEGQQIVSLTITDDGDTPLSTKVFTYLDIVDTLPVLTDMDSDGDLIPDNEEGYGDTDGDGIANYLDSNSRCDIQPADLSEPYLYLIKTESSICLHRGVNNSRNNFNSLLLNADEVIQDDEVINVGGIFDFVISGLPVEGQNVSLVLPQRLPIPENATYRKLITTLGWTEFTVDSNNYYSSAPGERGYCPAPNAHSWVVGLTPGHWCVQITIEDGGPNDNDGIANNHIVDPGGVAILNNNNSLPTIVSEQVTTTQNKPITVDVLANDTGSDYLSVMSANVDFGSVTIVDQQLYYQPDIHFFGSAVIIYTVSDGDNGTGYGEVTINVIENTAPVAVNDSATTNDRTPITIDILANDTDIDNDTLTILNAAAEQGSVVINNNILTYTPLMGFEGIDYVTYKISDNNGGENQGQISITINTKKSSGGSFELLFLLLFSTLLFIKRKRVLVK